MKQKIKNESIRKAGDAECVFCHSREKQDYLAINGRTGETIFLCSECLDLLHKFQTEEKQKRLHINQKLKSPEEIKAILDQTVIGQEAAKRVLSVAAYNHYKRIICGKSLRKSNILLSGPSGSGKTLFANALADCLDVPFVVADATSFTEAGYVGADVESCVDALLREAGGDVRLAEHGIIYIDEIDKLSRKGSSPSMARDISGEGVQNALLKLIEGTTVHIRKKGHRHNLQDQMVQVRTDQILFICGGAFDGIKKGQDKKEAGFLARQKTDQRNTLTAEDYIRYGMTPELMGRLPVIAQLTELTKEELMRVLTEPKNALISQYQDLLEMDGIYLEFTTEALERIAERALTNHTGARGLQTILEEVMVDIMYQAPSEQKAFGYRITEKTLDTHIPETFTPETVVRQTKIMEAGSPEVMFPIGC